MTHPLKSKIAFLSIFMMSTNHEHMDAGIGIEDLPDMVRDSPDVLKVWTSVIGLVGNMLTQVRAMTGRGKRGLTQNLAIAEGWLRMGLAQLAEVIVLRAPRPKKRRVAEAVTVVEEEPSTTGPRAPGFIAVLPDEFDLNMRKVGKPPFDISQFAGMGGKSASQPNPKAKYFKRLSAMLTVLENPERYARRAKRVLELRKKRSNIKFLPPPKPGAVLRELLSMPRNSDLIRTLTYWDPG